MLKLFRRVRQLHAEDTNLYQKDSLYKKKKKKNTIGCSSLARVLMMKKTLLFPLNVSLWRYYHNSQSISIN